MRVAYYIKIIGRRIGKNHQCGGPKITINPEATLIKEGEN